MSVWRSVVLPLRHPIGRALVAGVLSLLVLIGVELLSDHDRHGNASSPGPGATPSETGPKPGDSAPPSGSPSPGASVTLTATTTVTATVLLEHAEEAGGPDWPGWFDSAGTVVTPILVALLTYQLGRRSDQRGTARPGAGQGGGPAH